MSQEYFTHTAWKTQRAFPTTFHSKKYKNYYAKAKILFNIEDRAAIDSTDAVARGLAELGLPADTKVVWSSKQKCYLVQCEIQSVDAVVLIKERKSRKKGAKQNAE